MSVENSKVCSGGPKLIFACSGAADVGGVADQAARRMSKEGVGGVGVRPQISRISGQSLSTFLFQALRGTCSLGVRL
jgi:uncharacterized metal-binding protein